MYSPSINKLIDSFKRFPTVGQKTAERFVFYLLKSGKKEVSELMLALKKIMSEVKSCEICWNFSDANPCQICADRQRDQTTICVVSEPTDILAVEKTDGYNGLYHVLRLSTETINENGDLNNAKINELFKRIKNNPKISEIILALNPSLSGETTMMYLEKTIKKNRPSLKISRLARGLPMGSDLQYADEITLEAALKNRR